jgi:DNA-binding XRE family transcriptional regulator
MKKGTRIYEDIADYISTLSDKEQEQVAEAEKAIDLAFLLYKAREERGLTQAAAGACAGIKQQMVSKLEQTGANVELGTIHRYLGALGYRLTISLEDTTKDDR